MDNIKDLIIFYRTENLIIDRYRNQCLNYFPKIVNNSMFDKIILAKKKDLELIKRILKESIRNNDVELFEKICNNNSNIHISTIDKHGSYINYALHYNAYDVFVYLYSQNIPKKLYIYHQFINPKIFELLLKNKDECLNYNFFSMLLSDVSEVLVDNVKLMLEYKIDFEQENTEKTNKLFPNDESLLFLAANINTYILNLVYKENYVNSNNKTILHNAIKKENYFIVKYLIEEKKLNVNAKDINLSTPLHVACKKSNVDIVEILFLNGAISSLNSLDKGNRPPIYYAVINNNIEILKILIKYRADGYIDSSGYTLIEHANNNEIISLLLKTFKWHIKK